MLAILESLEGKELTPQHITAAVDIYRSLCEFAPEESPDGVFRVEREADDVREHRRAWDGTRDDVVPDLISDDKPKHVYIADLGSVPTRAVNALRKSGIVETFQLCHMTADELIGIPGIGETSVVAIKSELAKRGMRLA